MYVYCISRYILEGGFFLKINKELLKGSTTMIVLNLLKEKDVNVNNFCSFLTKKYVGF